MSQVRIFPADNEFSKKDLVAYLQSLGADVKSSLPSNSSVFAHSFNVFSDSIIHRTHLIEEVCRKLDTLNIYYEVIK